jgi:hypothetical protein
VSTMTGRPESLTERAVPRTNIKILGESATRLYRYREAEADATQRIDFSELIPHLRAVQTRYELREAEARILSEFEDEQVADRVDLGKGFENRAFAVAAVHELSLVLPRLDQKRTYSPDTSGNWLAIQPREGNEEIPNAETYIAFMGAMTLRARMPDAATYVITIPARGDNSGFHLTVDAKSDVSELKKKLEKHFGL